MGTVVAARVGWITGQDAESAGHDRPQICHTATHDAFYRTGDMYFKIMRLWCCVLNGAFVHVVDKVGGSVHPAGSNGSGGRRQQGTLAVPDHITNF
jgi:hypothetical protein